MSDDSFRVFPASPDTIVYEEGGVGADRSIRFGTRSMAEPPHVVVPDTARWSAAVPAWAASRRDEIVARLRGAGCVVVEVGTDVDRTLAPDGSFVVEVTREQGERGGEWETLRLLTVPGAESLTQVFNRGAVIEVRFGEPGIVVLGLDNHRGVRCRVRVDVRARTFRVDGGDASEPLDRLLDRLGWNDPPLYVSPPAATTAAGRAMGWVAVVACAVFVAGGLWMAVFGATAKDRWTGLAGVVFFGACGFGFLPPRRRDR